MALKARLLDWLGTAGTTNESARHSWVAAQLADVPPGRRLLDAGAGECQYRELCAHLDYVSQDFGQYSGTGEVGLHTGSWDNTHLDIVSDITDIPVPDDSFDVVLCTEVLEHVLEPHAALIELARVLRPGGRLILTAPFRSLTHFAPYHYATGFSRHFYERALPDLGLQVDLLEFNGNYFEGLAQEIRRVPSVCELYTPRKWRAVDRVVARYLLWRLSALSLDDKGSWELDAHGVHVVATKRVV